MKITQILNYETFKNDLLNVASMTEPFADRFWLRIKGEDDELVLKIGSKLRERYPNKFLILSSNAEIAGKLGYNAVQTGISGIPYDEIKSEYPDLLVGYSAHSCEEIEEKKADFYTLSPIFMTNKPYNVIPLGNVDVQSLNKEIYALGGIDFNNFRQLTGLGYAGIAGISFFREIQKMHTIISL